MVSKHFFGLATIASLSLALSAFGCSVDVSSTDNGNSSGGASSGSAGPRTGSSSGGGNANSSGGGGGGNGEQCFDPQAALFFQGETPKVAYKEGVCTTEQIADFARACLDNNTGSDQACQEFINNTDNEACRSCVVSGRDLIGPLTFVTETTVSLSLDECTYGAAQLERQCEKSLNEFYACAALGTCDSCENADFSACMQMAATNPPCDQVLPEEACQQAYAAKREAAIAECVPTGDAAGSFVAAFRHLAGVMCGN